MTSFSFLLYTTMTSSLCNSRTEAVLDGRMFTSITPEIKKIEKKAQYLLMML